MTTTHDRIQVNQFIRGDRGQVFRAWIEADQVRRWLCPEECQVIANQATVAVGGTYREAMRCGDAVHTVTGTYREIVPDRTLVFTHRWEEPDAVETVVRVEIVDRHDGSEVILTQTGFASAESADGHRQGWASALRNLANRFP